VAGIFLWQVPHIFWSDARASVAVLPFENLGSDGKEDLFSSGLMEELITDIGRMQPELRVITRVSAMQYQATRKSIGQIGRELKVSHILEGTVRHEGQRVRVSVQLVQVRDQTSVWAESYDRELGSALEIESEIARAVTNKIRVTLLATREVKTPTHSPYVSGSAKISEARMCQRIAAGFVCSRGPTNKIKT